MSDERNVQIEKRIDKQVTGALALHHSAGGTVIAPQNMTDLIEFAKLMAVSGQCVRPIFRGNPGACLAIALQAFRTGADPFAVANKAYQVNDQVAYEAQYVHAVVNTSGQLKKRLRPIFSGEGTKRKCMIRGEVVGEDEPLEYESPSIGDIPVKNSPLWKSDPDQQLFYYSTRAWARRHLPEVILGMYTRDEIEGETIDVTPPPRPRREDFFDPPEEETAAQSAPEPSHQTWTVTLPEGELREFDDPKEASTALIEAFLEAQTITAADALWTDNAAMARTLPDKYQGIISDADRDARERLVAKARASKSPAPAGTTPEPEKASTEPPAQAQATSERQRYEIAVPLRNGTPDYRTWFVALFMVKARQAKNQGDLAMLIGDNDHHIKRYREGLSPSGAVAMQKDIDDLMRALA